MEIALSDARFKELLKEALSELLVEKRQDFQELILDALEDVSLAKAIEEGKDTPLIERDEMMAWIDARI